MLTYSGYLTISSNLKLETYKIKIPNYEINLLFKKIIIKWLSNKIKIRRDLLISTSENLINNDLINFEKNFKEIIGDSLSYFDVLPKKDEYKKVVIPNEQFFHVYINDAIKKAISQIKIRKYYKEALENKIYRENIINVPIVFAGKEPYINKINY
ncbi:MAG: hypothetical protein B6I24_04385 [Bacteroidetes bacterium 4572_128]|nr:MAG: hypothetical protein B6I24_04385 [Bacteroidetes bacterium 4572_128]